MDFDTLKKRHRVAWAVIALCAAALAAVPKSVSDYLTIPLIALLGATLIYVLVLRRRMRRALAPSASVEKSLTTVLVLAAAVAALDVFMAGQALWSLMLCVVAILYYLPKALFALHDSPRMKLRLKKASGVLMIGAAALFVQKYDRDQQQKKVDSLIAAVQAYKAAQGKYPEQLQSLVPRYLPEVPSARLAAAASRFFYYSTADDATLMYVVFPPFGRKLYHFATGRWSQLD